jgi:ABC-type multidrug transport system permease subunit
MTLLATLLAKDLRRARRNPLAFAINLAVPLLITALIGLAFGGPGKSGGRGRIKIGIVDEDDSVISGFLKGAVNQGEGAQYLEPVFVSREDGLREITNNRLSAVVVLPKGFATDYLTGRQPVTIELIKNPAQSIYPAVIEELLGALTTGLNAVNRSFRPELAEWQALFERTPRPSPLEMAELVKKTGDRIEAARDYLFPPLVTYAKRSEAKPAAASGPGRLSGAGASASRLVNVFTYILPGMVAVFLLFVADNALRDLYREERFRTFDRFRTVREDLAVFIGAKVLFAMVVLLCGAAILFGGGALLFGIRWAHPAALAVLSVAYALFATGLMALIGSLAGKEQRADTLNSILGLGLGLAGGCMFPREQLPALLSQHVTPLMPTYWFAAATRTLQFGGDGPAWLTTAGWLAAVGAACVGTAACIFRRRLERGIRS